MVAVSISQIINIMLRLVIHRSLQKKTYVENYCMMTGTEMRRRPMQQRIASIGIGMKK